MQNLLYAEQIIDKKIVELLNWTKKKMLTSCDRE